MHLVSNSGTNQNNHGTSITTIFTAAELFPDGCAIDLMRRSQLIWWNGTTEEITPMIEFGGTTYRPTPLHTSVEEALRLPSGAAAYGTIEALMKALAKAAHDHIGLEEPASLLIAAFVAATWVPECLPGRGLVLNVWSPTATEPATLDFIEAVVRRPLRLLDSSIRELLRLPPGLRPTLIVEDPRKQDLRRLITTCAGRGGVLHGGCLATVRFSVVACTRRPIVGPILNVLVSASARDRGLSSRQMDELANEFQPQLQRYRLAQHLAIAQSRFAINRFAPAIRTIGSMVGAALEGATDLQEQLVEALVPLDEDAKVQQSAEPAALVLEAIMAASHEGKSLMFINEIAELANAIAIGRHDHLVLSPKEVGTIVRTELGLEPKRQGPGYRLSLDDRLKVRIHDIGRQFGVLTLLQSHPACAFCNQRE